MDRNIPQVMQQGRWVPWLYLLPGLIVLGIYVLYPTIRTGYISFRNEDNTGWAYENCDEDDEAACWGILENYHDILSQNTVTQPNVTALVNTLRWLLVIVPGTLILGMLFALLTERVKYTSWARAIIFMPMAISFVGASIIWRFVYHSNEDIGLLNAILTALGLQTQDWLGLPVPYSTFLLTIVGLWVWTGFTMTVLGAALSSIPTEIIEAARVDGANEFQLFFRIMLPQIMPTVAVVITTMTINTLKMFDIVWVMGGRQTDVIATRMVEELTQFRNFGQASAIAVLLIVLTLPVMYYNVRRFSIEEAIR